MAAYEDCKTKNILPVLFMALHVFRKFNKWSRLRSEADCAMAMVGPILEEVLHIQHEVKFTRSVLAAFHYSFLLSFLKGSKYRFSILVQTSQLFMGRNKNRS